VYRFPYTVLSSVTFFALLLAADARNGGFDHLQRQVITVDSDFSIARPCHQQHKSLRSAKTSHGCVQGRIPADRCQADGDAGFIHSIYSYKARSVSSMAHWPPRLHCISPGIHPPTGGREAALSWIMLIYISHALRKRLPPKRNWTPCPNNPVFWISVGAVVNSKACRCPALPRYSRSKGANGERSKDSQTDGLLRNATKSSNSPFHPPPRSENSGAQHLTNL